MCIFIKTDNKVNPSNYECDHGKNWHTVYSDGKSYGRKIVAGLIEKDKKRPNSRREGTSVFLKLLVLSLLLQQSDIHQYSINYSGIAC